MKDQFRQGAVVLDNALAFWVNRFYEASRRVMYRAFRAHDVELTPEQWMVLVRLWERDRQTQGELAQSTARDAPTISRVIDSMEGRDLVRRVLDPEDARSRRVTLTNKARSLRTTLVPIVESLVARIENDIPEADLEITRRTLRRLVSNAEGLE